MNSSKQSTQRRMLSNKAAVNSPRLARLGARSPNNKSDSKKTQTRASIGTAETLRDLDTAKSSNKLPQIDDAIPQRATQNIQQGQIQFQNKDRYEGGMNNGKMYGKGTYYFYEQNLKYTGQFYDNLFHGWGAITKNYGSQSPIYEGNFQYGKKHGQGKYEYGPNHYYNGNWAFDKKQGQGIYYYPEGLYNGEWHQNQKHGQGTLKLNDGTQFKGTFQNDDFVKGLIRYPNGDQYSGDFLNGQRQGEGSYFSLQTQERYKGQWKADKKHGRGNFCLNLGTVYMQNGDQVQCTFVNGKIDETQSISYKWNSGEDEGNVFNGWFKNGKPQKGHVITSDGQEYDTY